MPMGEVVDNQAPAMIDNIMPDMQSEETLGLYSLEAEMSLLGAVLIDPSVLSNIQIEISDFHDIKHKLICRAILAAQANGGITDISTIAEQLRKWKKLEEAGGPVYLAQLTLSTSFNTVGDEKIIKDYSRRRKALDIFQNGARSAITSAEDLNLDWAISRLNELKIIDKTKAHNFSSWADLDGVIGPICWDWKFWMARGFLNILVGMTGEGKSILALRICGCYLLGWDWPDGTHFTGKIGKIIWSEAEAAQALNLERAKNWGLPIENILSPLGDPLGDFRLKNDDHKSRLAQMVLQDEVVFAVVDSLSGADPTAERSTEDTNNINWLAALARDSQKPIQLTHHLRKRNIFDIEGTVTLDRVRGISTILQYSRLIWALDAPDPNTETKRLSVIKSNLSKKPDPIGVVIGDGGVIFGSAPQAPHIETIADKAADLLLTLLKSQPMSAGDLEKEIEQAGISWRSAERAKKSLNIVSIKKEDGRWYWSLPTREEQRDAYTEH